ncbi:MAG: transglutaminase domain-containing protein [Ktedonobacterales bacterium]
MSVTTTSAKTATPAVEGSVRHPRAAWFHLLPSDGWLTLLLTIIIIVVTVFSIEAVTPTWTSQGIGILNLTLALGIVLGYIAVQQRLLPSIIVHTIATVLGIVLAFTQTANAVLLNDDRELARRTWIWFQHAFAPNASSSDNSVFLLFLATLTFLLAYISMWLVFHTRRPWLAVLANGVVLLINIGWSTSDEYYFLVLFLLAALLLLVRFTLAENTRYWRAIGLRFSPDLGWDFMQAGAFFAIVVVLIPNLLPAAIQSQALNDYFNAPNGGLVKLEARVQSLFAGAGGRGTTGPGFFTSTLQLQGSVNLPNVQVLHYHVGSSGAGDAQQYLITQAFDSYNGSNTWTNSTIAQTTSYQANQTQPASSQTHHTDVYDITFDLTPIGGEQYIFAPGSEAASFSVPSNAQVSTLSFSAMSWQAQTPMPTDDAYVGAGYVSDATEQQLKQLVYPSQFTGLPSQSPYPPNMLEQYLPSDQHIDPLIAQRAQEVTRGAPTMYQAALDIQSYLRTFTYSTQNPEPPANQDATAWFLKTQRGFCTFFASAMALMGRSLGMPTRVVSGYTAGVYDPRSNSYIVKGTQAHTWTQIYFGAKYGWINFEPTAQFSQFVRPVPASTVPTVGPGTPQPHGSATASPSLRGVTPGSSNLTRTGASQRNTLLIQLGLGIALTIALVLALYALFVLWWRLLYRNLSPTGASLGRVALLGSWAGVSAKRSQTPSEYAEALGKLLPSQRSALRQLSDLYTRERWGGGATTAAADEAPQLYEHIRGSLVPLIIRRARSLPSATLRRLRSGWRTASDR